MRDTNCPSTSATTKYMMNIMTSVTRVMRNVPRGGRKKKSQSRALAVAVRKVGPRPTKKASSTTPKR
jgi:hypothetical protein